MDLIAAECLRIAKDGRPRIFSLMELNDDEADKEFLTKRNNFC